VGEDVLGDHGGEMKTSAIKGDAWEVRSDGGYHLGYVWQTATTFYARGYGDHFNTKVQGSSRDDAIAKLKSALNQAKALD
jgi:hypothetical protein